MQTYDKMNMEIYSISGPIVKIKGETTLFINEMVYVGEEHLIGEVSAVSTDETIIQVFENTTGLKAGDPITRTKNPLSVTLGPGLLSGIYDGICRPLDKIEKATGSYIGRGVNIPSVDGNRAWDITLKVKVGDRVDEGDIYATVQESSIIEHRFIVPDGICGKIKWVCENGSRVAKETICEIESDEGSIFKLSMLSKWPLRKPRRVKKRLPPKVPLLTGQRVIDTLFPIVKGGAAAIPGGFGAGKTMLQHQLAKWSDADLIVYIGCGERGNEMTQVLEEFSELIDPRTGKSMLERTILIANTSNMPVAAREASIYSGVTLAEYYRDMGYHVAVMADSTSRWAEALREISGRLEEMPAEEGFPAYLPSRLSAFYERAGLYETLGGRTGSVTIIGAVSPQGNDFSEPVTQNTKRFIRCFWALDKSLAYSRHYPAVNWNISYSEYAGELQEWFNEKFGTEYSKYREEMIRLLAEESSLMDIVKLIGADLLADEQKAVLDIARVIRAGFLQQNATSPIDSYVPLEKQFNMMKYCSMLYEKTKELLKLQIPQSVIRDSGVYELMIKAKYEIPNDDLGGFTVLWSDITHRLGEVEERYR